MKTRTCTRCFMQMSFLYASDLPFKNFTYARYLTSFGFRVLLLFFLLSKKQIEISFLCVSPLIKDKFRLNLSSTLGLARPALCKWATCTRQTCLSKALYIPSIWPVSGLVIVKKNKLTSVFRRLSSYWW